MSDYEAFLARKAPTDVPTGIPVPPSLSPKLKEHQQLLTSWALRRGRAAIFAQTGLGKGWMILEWSRVVAEHSTRPVLILAPLSVSQQFAREAEKLGTGVTICSSQSDVRDGINVTNYHKLHKFDPATFGGIACDESSIFKSLDGQTRRKLIDSFRATPFRLAATATPAPNDHTELGGHAEFLGVMTHTEMLGGFFYNDGGDSHSWQLRGHARSAFWRWVASWGAIVNLPSDIGCSDDGYILPDLRYHSHVIAASPEDVRHTGLLFAQPANTLTEQRAARKGSLASRVEACAEILNEVNEPGIAWCDLNLESSELSKKVRGAVEVTGSMSDDDKEAAIESFVTGRSRVLVSKPSLAGFGLNLQFARRVVFCGVSHSFEQFFQAIRRSWRFGVAGEVNVHVVTSELEGRVVDSLREKQRKAEESAAETRGYVSEYVRQNTVGSVRKVGAYHPGSPMRLPNWLKGEVA